MFFPLLMWILSRGGGGDGECSESAEERAPPAPLPPAPIPEGVAMAAAAATAARAGGTRHQDTRGTLGRAVAVHGSGRRGVLARQTCTLFGRACHYSLTRRRCTRIRWGGNDKRSPDLRGAIVCTGSPSRAHILLPGPEATRSLLSSI